MREYNALAFGLISILDLPDAPSRPIVWMVDMTYLWLASDEDDHPVSEELRHVMELLLERFFIHITPIAPQLAGLNIGPVPAADDRRTLH